MRNDTVRQVKLKFRNFINEITGQQKLIDTFNGITQTIATTLDAQDNPTAKEPLDKLYCELGEDVWTPSSTGAGWEITGFNPYKPFQKKRLREKIEAGQNGLKRLGIQPQ